WRRVLDYESNARWRAGGSRNRRSRRDARHRRLPGDRSGSGRTLQQVPDGPVVALAVTSRTRVMMDPLEAQARAIIAAALIVRGAVEIPTMPSPGQRAPDAAGLRLRELTDYVYRLLTIDEPHE